MSQLDSKSPGCPVYLEALYFKPYVGYLRFHIYVMNAHAPEEDMAWFMDHPSHVFDDGRFGEYWRSTNYRFFGGSRKIVAGTRDAVRFILSVGVKSIINWWAGDLQAGISMHRSADAERAGEWLKVCRSSARLPGGVEPHTLLS